MLGWSCWDAMIKFGEWFCSSFPQSGIPQHTWRSAVRRRLDYIRISMVLDFPVVFAGIQVWQIISSKIKEEHEAAIKVAKKEWCFCYFSFVTSKELFYWNQVLFCKDTQFSMIHWLEYTKRGQIYMLMAVKTIQNGNVVSKDLAPSYINTKYTNPVITVFTTTLLLLFLINN